MHINYLEEKVHMVLRSGSWEDSDDYMSFRQLFAYICQFQTFSMFVPKGSGDFVFGAGENVLGIAPGYIWDLTRMRLEFREAGDNVTARALEIQSVKDLPEMIRFASSLGLAEEATLHVQYAYNRAVVDFEEGPFPIRPIAFRPAYEFFDFGHWNSSIPSNVALSVRFQLSDIEDEAYFFRFSPLNSTELLTDNNLEVSGLKEVKDISSWRGDYLNVGVDIPESVSSLALFKLKVRFKAFVSQYDVSGYDIWDNTIEEYKGRIQGAGNADFMVEQNRLDQFLLELTELNDYVKSLAPDAALILYGSLVSIDPRNPFAAIRLSMEDGKIFAKIIRLPE